MIGERIKEARNALGYSAEQVAEFLNVSPATVYRYENGDISKLPSKYIKPLAEFLCVSPAYLMGWSDSNSSDSSLVEEKPKNDDIRLLIRGLNRLSPAQFEQAKNMMRIMFSEYAEYFENRKEDDE